MRAEAPSGAREHALDGLLARVDHTAATLPPGPFPESADPATGRWDTTPDGGWTGGFWIGQLWLAGACRDGDGDRDRRRESALQWARLLAPRAQSPTIFRGFLFYYGAVVGHLLTGEPELRELALAGARGLARDFNEDAGLIPLGEGAEEAHAVGADQTNVDGVSASALLLWAAAESGEERLREVALRHALSHEALCVRDDDSVCQSAVFDLKTGTLVARYTHKGVADDSTWARAQAWAMVGYALAARWAPEEPRLLALAERVADWWIAHVPGDLVARWDFDVPLEEDPAHDTSATAIAAAALLKLAELSGDPARRERYARHADATIDALLPYVKPVGPAGCALTEGCYDRRTGRAMRHELVWGSCYLVESLAATTGRLGDVRP